MTHASEYINGRKVHRVIDGVPLNFTRRRYGKTTFTWVEAFDGLAWRSLGDPWPAITPAANQIREAVKNIAA
jgi:hypothetical protein